MDNERIALCDGTVCSNCNSEINGSYCFCPVCGAGVKNEARSDGRRKKQARGGLFAAEVVKRSFILALSILLVVSAFLPMFTVKADMYDLEMDVEVDVEFDAIDGVVMAVDAMHMLNDEEMEESELVSTSDEDIYQVVMMLLSGKRIDKLISDECKSQIRLNLRSEDTPFEPAYIGVALLCIVYMLSAVCALIFSALAFVSLFTDKIRDLHKVSVKTLIAVPLLLVLASMSFVSAYGLVWPNSSMALTAFQTVVLCIVFAVALGLVLYRIFAEGVKYSVGFVMKRCCSLVLAIVVLVAAFLPVIVTTVDTVFDQKEKKVEAHTAVSSAIFSELNLSEDEAKAIVETRKTKNAIDQEIKAMYSNISIYKKINYERGEVYENVSILSRLVLGYGLYEISWLFGMGGLCVILAALGATIVIWQNLVALMCEYSPRKRWTIPAKVIAVLGAVVVLALSMMVAYVASFNADSIDLQYSVSVGVAPVIAVVAAIAVACIPMGSPRRRRSAEQIYAEPSVAAQDAGIEE